MNPELVVIGHIVNERIEFPDRVVFPVLGSPAAYSSAAAARLGTKTGLVTRIGGDFPSHLLEPLRDAGVDVGGVVRDGHRSTVNLLKYHLDGTKSVSYLSKAPDITWEDVPHDFIEDCRLVYVCPMDYEVSMETVRSIRLSGATMAVDLGGFGGATSGSHPDPDSNKGSKEFVSLVGLFDIAKLSKEDARHILGDVTGRERWAAGALVDWGADVGMITMGEEGVAVATRNSSWIVPGCPAKAADTTGAGDSYSGGFLAEYLLTRDVDRSARFGCATASLVIEKSGGVVASRMPTRYEVEARMKQVIW